MVSAEEAVEHNKAQLVAIVLKHNIQAIKVEFAGSGDDGCIDYIHLTNTRGEAMNDICDLDCSEFQSYGLNRGRVWTGSGWEHLVDSLSTVSDLNNLIEPLIYTLIEQTNIDWVNGDGGFGQAAIVRTGDGLSFNLEIHQRYTDSHCEHDEHEIWSPLGSVPNPRVILSTSAHPVTADDFL